MYKKVIVGLVFLMGFFSLVSAASWNLPGVKIITRSQWGANEEGRYAPESKTERDALRQQQKEAEMLQLMENDTEKFFDAKRIEYEGQMATDYLITNTPTEQTVEEYRESSSGNFLKWPESIHKNKSKIIIHHTADDNTALLTGGTGVVIKQLQDIYKYHTLTKGRGDIGYNFVIDPFGNVYEGRAGGEGVVGAHVSRNNTPSVGISLMGNFNINKPTEKALTSLVKLTTALAKKYKINPKATTNYFKKSDEPPYLEPYKNYTIAGHTDAGVTSCPGTNLYNLLPDVREKVSKNLITTSLVSYTKTSPSTNSTKINKGTTVAGRYYSDKDTETFTLPIRWKNVTACTSTDTGIVINRCRSQNNQLQLSVTKKGYSGLKSVAATTASGTQKFSFLLIRDDDLNDFVDKVKTDYQTRKSISPSSSSFNKISYKIPLSEVKTLIQTPLNILLYELSKSYSRYELSCDGRCTIKAGDKTYTAATPIVETSNGVVYLTIPTLENPLAVSLIEISSSSGGLVRVNNYARKSYGGIAWNSFRGSLIWKKESIKDLVSGKFGEQIVVLNKTSFDNYMKGIAETSDADNVEKQTLVLLLAKMYALFYLNGKNTHPSIPAGASYQAIDNPDMFQKYVGAGREKTSTMSAKLLTTIQDKVVLYDGYVPILPYFSCSAGFTWSAKEKWGWNDTPYLQSKLDFAACFDFNGHGVGLSGKGAQYLAQKGRTLEQILTYYYPGTTLSSTNN